MKTLFILLLSFLCMETFAQQDQQESTLFSADILYNGEVEQQYSRKHLDLPYYMDKEYTNGRIVTTQLISIQSSTTDSHYYLNIK